MHKLQLVAALAQVVATQAAQHKVTRHAVPRELTDSLAAAASTANAIKLPAAVATLFGQAAGAAAPAKVSRGPMAQHQDRFKGGDEAEKGDSPTAARQRAMTSDDLAIGKISAARMSTGVGEGHVAEGVPPRA